MSAMVYVNGQISDASTASVPVFDHGFLYGEGVYETLRTYGLEPFHFERHTRRLRNSADMMRLPVPFSDRDALRRVTATTAPHNTRRWPEPTPNADPTEKYIRILLTRGVGELSYQPESCPTPTLVIIVKPLPMYAERTFTEGIRLALVGIR